MPLQLDHSPYGQPGLVRGYDANPPAEIEEGIAALW